MRECSIRCGIVNGGGGALVGQIIENKQVQSETHSQSELMGELYSCLWRTTGVGRSAAAGWVVCVVHRPN